MCLDEHRSERLPFPAVAAGPRAPPHCSSWAPQRVASYHFALAMPMPLPLSSGMTFDVSRYRTAGLFWVVETRDGRIVPGLITTIGDGDHSDIRVERADSPAVTIANGDIVAIRSALRPVADEDDDD